MKRKLGYVEKNINSLSHIIPTVNDPWKEAFEKHCGER